MRKKALTTEQIEEAKYLRKMGYTKHGLSLMYGVGKTTIWENVFSKSKRKFVRSKNLSKKKELRVPCEICEVYMKEELESLVVPSNFRVGYICLSCYLHKNGLQYRDIFKI